MDADEVIKVKLSSTCECGGKIAIYGKPYIHQKVDLPEIKPYVVIRAWPLPEMWEKKKQ